MPEEENQQPTENQTPSTDTPSESGDSAAPSTSETPAASTTESGSKVTVYSTPTCPWCEKTKEFLKENNISYEGVDVSTDEQARNRMFEKSGQFGVPVVEIGETVIVGFDKEAIKKALKI